MKLEGSWVALVTPFTKEGSIDFAAFRKLLWYQVQEGVEGLVICGSTGEGSTLSTQEQNQLITVAVESVGAKVPIIAGTGSNSTQEAVERTKLAKQAGADAALVILPYYNKPSLAGCVLHIQSIAACGLPIILYYNPGRCGSFFSAEQIASLLEIEGVVACKDSSGNIDYTAELIRLSSKPIFMGDDSLTFPGMGWGAVGVISVVGNLFPRFWTQCVHLALQGKMLEAREAFGKFALLGKALFLESNPVGIKYAMSLSGLCCSSLRLPLVEPQEKNKQAIEKACQEFRGKL